jgi:hypothetical protein
MNFTEIFLIYKNKYKRLNSEDFHEMYKPVLEKYFSKGEFTDGAKNIGQHFYLKKYASDFMDEMNRSVRTALKNWRKK